MARSPLTDAQKEQIKRALASGSRMGAADLRLINIDVYKERLGKEWFKFKPIIAAMAAGAIKAELEPQDFFIETGDGYGIFFFEQDPAQVQAISDRIADRLEKDLCREPDFGSPPLGCKAVSVDCKDFLRQLEGGSSQREPDEAPRMATPAVDVEAHYLPLWHAKLQRIVGSICIPRLKSSALPKFSDRNYYEPSAQHAERDIQTFNKMLTEAYKLHKAGTSTTIVFSLNFKSFCVPEYRKLYLHALKQAPGSLVQYLTPRFVRVPPGTPQTVMAEKAQLLGATFKRVMIHTRPAVEAGGLQFVSGSILSASWGEIVRTAGEVHDHAKLVSVAQAFCQAAKGLRMNALIDAIDTAEGLEVALAAGADFASGVAIAPESANPSVQRPLGIAEIRNRAKKAAANIGYV